ncbi:hypothetical protein FACS1894130_09130 [Spirochaetia bacterium]|nr:hypothetical protein FACS1894130_09130 [Spirochaetia bacterium]
MGYTLIQTGAQLAKFENYVADHNITRIAMDFEGEFNLHIYGRKLCLIQLFDNKNFFLIDPFNIADSELIRFFTNKKIVKYMFGCGSDMELIYYQYGVKLKSVFDLQLCTEVLNLPFQGLDRIINEVLHVEIKNKKMYQMFNWTVRPIRKDALEYALGDVKYLFEIYACFMDEIKKQNLWDVLIEKMVKSEFDYEKDRKPKLLTSKEYLALPRDKKERFNTLFEAREALAKKFNLPPNLVIANSNLFVLTADIRYADTLPFCNKINGKMKEEITDVLSKLHF